MHPGDLLDIGTLKAAIEVEFIGGLWVAGDSGPMTPYVCEAVQGDGMHLLKISTINQRPNYHVIRVDSSFNPVRDRYYDERYGEAAEICEIIDDLLTLIEEECGSGRPYEEGDEDYDPVTDGEGYGARDPWPAIDDRDGCGWGEIRWSWLMKEIGYTAMLDRLAPKREG